MNFVSLEFLAFVTVVYSTYWCLPWAGARKWTLILASYGFYAAWNWRFCFLMLGVTLNAYVAGRALTTLDQRWGRHLIGASIGIDLACLGFFKYCDFFIGSVAAALGRLGIHASVPALQIILPVGISFYTFHAISYVLDVARGKVQSERSFGNVALYIAFFPQLIAGPIVRASFFMPQLHRRPPFSKVGQGLGIRLFIRGLIYKAIIADALAQIADPIFANVRGFDNYTLASATVAFYGQIYFDFAGYSSMAIGTARLFGYRIPKNFDYPYLSTSVTEFWRRWHISLSSWLRDYLYFQLGGSRGSRLEMFRNLMLTMVLGGLWHGAAWTFVVWGAMHGLGLCAHKTWLAVRPRLRLGIDWNGTGWRVAAIVLTQLWVMSAWIFFRCGSFAGGMRVLHAFLGGIGKYHPGVYLILAVIAADHAFGAARLRWRAPPVLARPVLWIGIGALAALVILCLPVAQKPFIYFQF